MKLGNESEGGDVSLLLYNYIIFNFTQISLANYDYEMEFTFSTNKVSKAEKTL